jgi:O-antigen chain-terminating methyltransferase
MKHLKTYIPSLTKDSFKEKLKEEINKSQHSHKNVHSYLASTDMENYINSLLQNAERFNQDPEWPRKLNIFPLNLGIIQNISLKIYKLIFKKQRVVNESIIYSLKSILEITQIQSQYIEQLKEKYNQVIGSLEEKNKKIAELEQVIGENSETLSNFIASIQDEKLDQYSLDWFYSKLEDTFRGEFEDIYNRLTIYIPYVEQMESVSEQFPILDIGCGRGEWLKLMQDIGYSAIGIDCNQINIETCRKQNLNVIYEDAISYLKSVSSESISIITAFHIIEHLEYQDLLVLFKESKRILKTGGMLIFETPNPENILVSTCTFYTDPTHKKPLPSSLIEFIAQLEGFCNIEILRLHPYPEHLTESSATEQFKKHFYSAQDYTLIAYKN